MSLDVLGASKKETYFIARLKIIIVKILLHKYDQINGLLGWEKKIKYLGNQMLESVSSALPSRWEQRYLFFVYLNFFKQKMSVYAPPCWKYKLPRYVYKWRNLSSRKWAQILNYTSYIIWLFKKDSSNELFERNSMLQCYLWL